MANSFDRQQAISDAIETMKIAQQEANDVTAACARIRTNLVNLRKTVEGNVDAFFSKDEDLQKIDAFVASIQEQIKTAIG